MENKKNSISKSIKEEKSTGNYRKDAPGAISGINTPGIELPAFTPTFNPAINPAVPNRAWTAMQTGMDIDQLSEEEKRDLYIGHDGIF